MTVEVFNLGACLLSAPTRVLWLNGSVVSSWSRHQGGKTAGPYTLDEAIQIIDFFRGEIDIPARMRFLCGLQPEHDPVRLAKCLDTAEVVLVEINSPVAIMFGRYALCRSDVIKTVLDPITCQNDTLARLSNAWYHQGMMAGNEAKRAETAEKLVAGIPHDMPDADLARDVLLNSRPYQRDLDGLVEGLASVRASFKGRLGVVTYTHQYLPDGRPLPWPTDFVEMTVEAAKRLSLPVFEPSKYVIQYGVTRALEKDMVHYRPEFSEALAEPLLEFIHAVADGSNRAMAGVQSATEPA